VTVYCYRRTEVRPGHAPFALFADARDELEAFATDLGLPPVIDAGGVSFRPLSAAQADAVQAAGARLVVGFDQIRAALRARRERLDVAAISDGRDRKGDR